MVVKVRESEDMENGEIPQLSVEEGWALFDHEARLYLGMSGEEFIEQWDNGAFGEPDSQPGVMWVAELLPLARRGLTS